MAERAPAARALQLEVLARIIAPQAMRARDTGKGFTPNLQHQVNAALVKASAIQAAVELQLSMGQTPPGSSGYLAAAAHSTENAMRLLAEAVGYAQATAVVTDRMEQRRLAAEEDVHREVFRLIDRVRGLGRTGPADMPEALVITIPELRHEALRLAAAVLGLPVNPEPKMEPANG